jgi:hypothetical protein
MVGILRVTANNLDDTDYLDTFRCNRVHRAV